MTHRPTASTITDDQLDALHAEHDRLAEAVEAVHQIHRPARDRTWATFGCDHDGEHTRLCASCRTCYPCPTVKALPTEVTR